MTRDPGSLWSPLTEDGRQGSYTKTQFIVHSTGDRGTAAAIFNYFNRNDVVVESTFVVGRGPEDPTRQLLDSASGADANLGANRTGIAVEVVGTADDPFTDWQIAELIRLGRWAHGVHPIPLRVVPAPTAGGYGWHVMFGAPGPWTPVAKVCPGRTRIQQLQTVVFPAIFADIPYEEDFLSALTNEEQRRLLTIADELRWGVLSNDGLRVAVAAVQAQIQTLAAAGGVDAGELAAAGRAGAEEALKQLAAKMAQ